MTDTPDEKILAALLLAALRQYTWRTGAQLAEMTGLRTDDLYPAILRLEQANMIRGEWEDMPPPRRRRYRLTGRGRD